MSDPDWPRTLKIGNQIYRAYLTRQNRCDQDANRTRASVRRNHRNYRVNQERVADLKFGRIFFRDVESAELIPARANSDQLSLLDGLHFKFK